MLHPGKEISQILLFSVKDKHKTQRPDERNQFLGITFRQLMKFVAKTVRFHQIGLKCWQSVEGTATEQYTVNLALALSHFY